MWGIILTIILCALANRIRGGGPTFIRDWVRRKYPKIDPYLNGDTISPILFALICCLWMPWYLALGGGLGWLLGWAPDIGDRVQELRNGSWKLAAQRGVFLGACIALGTWNPAFIIAGAFFAPVYWLTIDDPKGWGNSEWLMGAILSIPLVLAAYPT